VTSPFFVWLLWPRRRTALSIALWAAIVPIAMLDLTYHNSGWLQFGYRFSNDSRPT